MKLGLSEIKLNISKFFNSNQEKDYISKYIIIYRYHADANQRVVWILSHHTYHQLLDFGLTRILI